MSVEGFYEKQSNLRSDGRAFGGRIEKAGRLFVRHLSAVLVERFLDVGCGIGVTGVRLARTMGAKEIYGVDVAPSYVNSARQIGIRAERVDVSREMLPFPDDFFQAIFCGEVLEHLIDPDHLLDEIQRVLQPEGCCVLTTPNLAGWHNRLALLFGAQPFPTEVSVRYPHAGKLFSLSSEGLGLHLRVFTYRALRRILVQHKFTVLETLGISLSDTNPSAVLPRWLEAILLLVRPLDGVLSRFPALSSCLVMAIGKP